MMNVLSDYVSPDKVKCQLILKHYAYIPFLHSLIDGIKISVVYYQLYDRDKTHY
jgi:hypothetical protein